MLNKEEIKRYHEDGYIIPEFKMPENDLLEIEKLHDKLIKNYNAIIDTLEKEKNNNTVKGDLIKSAFITSTMGVSYKLKLGKNI